MEARPVANNSCALALQARASEPKRNPGSCGHDNSVVLVPYIFQYMSWNIYLVLIPWCAARASNAPAVRGGLGGGRCTGAHPLALQAHRARR